jgi:hypothetical protein
VVAVVSLVDSGYSWLCAWLHRNQEELLPPNPPHCVVCPQMRAYRTPPQPQATSRWVVGEEGGRRLSGPADGTHVQRVEQVPPLDQLGGHSMGWEGVNQEAGLNGVAGAPMYQRASPRDPLVEDEGAEGACPNEEGDDCNRRLSEEGGPRL